MYRPELGILGVPAPDNGLLFHSVTAASAGKFLGMSGPRQHLFRIVVFVEFRSCLSDLLQRTDASSISNVVWVYEKISSFSAASDEWTNEIDLLTRY